MTQKRNCVASKRILWRNYCIQFARMTFLASVLALSAPAQDLIAPHGEPRYQAVRVETGPKVDGDLSDPVWQQAAVMDRFVQQVPHYGSPATEKTEVRILYDSAALYIGVYCYESDRAGMVSNVLRFRDEDVWRKDDVVRIALDTFHDHRRTYAFSINARGAKQDAQVDNQVWNVNWDEVWENRTRMYEDGWSLEIRIPFRILRFPPGGGGVWGLQVLRSIKRKNEIDVWAPVRPGIFFFRPSLLGHLEGLAGIDSPRNIQLIPYGLMGMTGSNNREKIVSQGDGGADLKVAVTSALSLDLTYNTNFAQVEADDQQINLTRFSLFFPEKREFFLENSQLFNFGLDGEAQFFFSRRIGLVEGQAVPILGGARLSGRLGAFDLGLLTTQTEDHPKAPGANLSVGRMRWNVGQRSYIGGIFTSVASETQQNRVIGPDLGIWLRPNLRWEGYWAVLDDPSRAGHPSSYYTGLLYDQDLWEVTLQTLRVDKDFQPALGFFRRTDIQRQLGKLRRSWRLNRPWARKVSLSGQLTYLTNRQGDLDTRQWALVATNEFDSGDIVRVQWERNFERLRLGEPPFVLYPGKNIVVSPGDYSFQRWLVGYEGFEGRAWRVQALLHGGEFYGGDRTAFTFSGTWRTSPHLVLGGDYEYNNVSVPQGDFATHLWRARVNVPVTARANVDALVQWNGLTEERNTQLRFHLLYARDSNFFVVFTDQKRNLLGGKAERDWAIQLKLTYRLYL
ncbi:MAG: carbohydrate binding family 9 domain-containing protein [Acidobacteria bacterium]|nr:carbohydrate binding family 9 domain-containing protein [Acidobacteriota bacterium]